MKATSKRPPLKVIATCILILVSGLELYAVIHYIDNFINGFAPGDFVGVAIGDTVYGFQAIKQDEWAHLIYIPVFHVASLIQCLYFGITMKKTRRGKIIWSIVSAILLLFNISLWIFLI